MHVIIQFKATPNNVDMHFINHVKLISMMYIRKVCLNAFNK